MAPPHQVTTLCLLLLVSSQNLVSSQHNPFFFNYQPQQQQQQQFQPHDNYQPFTNTPPGTYYQPTYESHTAGGGGGERGPGLLGSFFNDASSPTQASNPLVTYPTQVTTVSRPQTSSSSGTPNVGHLQHQQPSFQPIGNSLFQQPTITTSNNQNNNAFRPSSPFLNHHTHIVNGLPKQQFFGNNYAFFRERHGLTNIPATTGPFSQHNGLSNPAPASQPPPTPAQLVSSSAAPSPSAQTAENGGASNQGSQQQQPSRPPPPPSTFAPHFSNFLGNNHGPSDFPPDSNQSTKPTSSSDNAIKTKPIVANLLTASPTTSSSLAGISPSFAYSQYFPETDTGNNELARQPLFEEEEGERETYNSNNNNAPTVYHVQPQRAPPTYSAPTSTAAPPPPPVKSQQSGQANALSNSNSQTKEEPTPIRIHNTQPIRIVFNYEQAVEALEENPGVRVVIAQTEKNNLTDEESTTRPPLDIPSARSVSPSTTSRPYQHIPSTYGTHRPLVEVTPRSQPAPVPRYEYEPVNVPYTTRTTAAALENLALELEGRFDSTSRPDVDSGRHQVYQTVATLATNPSPTESSLQTFRRGSKKFVVVPSKDNVYKAEEPVVRVNDLASIVVQTLAPSPSYPAPTQPAIPTYSFPPYQEARQEVDEEDLEDEIENLSQQLRQTIETTAATEPPTTTTTTTTTTPRPRPRPTPRLRITTYRPATTYRPTPRRTPPPPPPPPVEIEEEPIYRPAPRRIPQPPPPVEQQEEQVPTQDEIPGNFLLAEPPTPGHAPRYLYNNRAQGGLSGAHQRYEYNGLDGQQDPPAVKPRRRQRPRGRLVAGSPPRAVQVNTGPGPFGQLGGPGGPPPLHLGPLPLGPGGPLPLGPGGPLPVPPGAPIPGPVFRVGPRGRLLRRKTRPRPQGPAQQHQLATAGVVTSEPPRPEAPPSPSSSPVLIRDLPPVPQELSPEGPFPHPLYSPAPFLHPNELVTTFRPGPPPNLLVQQSIAVDEEAERPISRPSPLPVNNNRFRFSPRPTAPSTTTASRTQQEDESEEASNQYDSAEEAPSPPQRRRPQFSTTTSTTEAPRQPIGDRANILQRQIRFRNQKKNQKNDRS